jgi:hypothetical protein
MAQEDDPNKVEVAFSPAECAAFGISIDEARAISKWTMERVGYVLGLDGRGGSGVFVEMSDGRTALLTARHVLVPAILSGEVTVAHYLSRKIRSIEPTAIRFAARSDAAIVVVPDGLVQARLAKGDWNPDGALEALPGQGAIAAGAPGEWKAEPDLARRVIESMKTLLFWTAVVDADAGGLLVCDVDEKLATIPSTFRGMSGGPVFDIGRRLLGINKGEQRGRPDARLFATPRRSWQDLYSPFLSPDDMPTDYTHQTAVLQVSVSHESSPTNSHPILATFLAEFFWSPSNPTHKFGEFGLITAMMFGHRPATTRYRINVESIFFLPVQHNQRERLQAFRDEAVLMLEEMGYRVLPPGTPGDIGEASSIPIGT